MKKLSGIAGALGLVSLLIAPRAGAEVPAWVQKSNAAAQPLLRAIGAFSPEQASGWGLAEYDVKTADVGPDRPERELQALAAVKSRLEADVAAETNPLVRQDIEIMLHAVDVRAEGIRLERKYLIPYYPAGRMIFQGEFTLLNDQTPFARHASAADRLQRYVGLAAGSRPLVEAAEAVFESRMNQPGLIGPVRAQVEQDIGDTERYARNVRQLFVMNRVSAGPALGALDSQLRAYTQWLRTVVLPHSRVDFRMPAELYAHRLREVGLDLTPDQIIAKAELEFSEVTNELQSLAPVVAAQHGWPEKDYRAVIHHLKREQMPRDEVEPYYRNVVIPRLEALIREHRVATLPDRPMEMRIASEGEAAIQPAPHMQPPALINNHGERGTFVLPLGNPSSGGTAEAYDDFTFKAGTWTLTAHEGRPGHELQFDRMVERGVSLARSVFAFNSVNVEGWALYCESEMKPYESLDAQMIVLQLRLLRSVRAFTDPMMNLGRMTRERGHSLLVDDVCLSEAFAREELDRFSFRMPGQATSYFYGYTRLLELRAATQITMGKRFDRLAFNDFIVDQGLLPPNLLAAAVQKWSAQPSE